MNEFQASLRKVAVDLRALKARWAVVGGVAASAHGSGRFTNDIDVAVVVHDDSEAELFTRRFEARGYRIAALVEDELTARLRTVPLYSHVRGQEQLFVDLLFETCGIEPEIVDGAQEIEVLRGVRVPVARPAHIIAMKLVSHRDDRLRDLDDIEALVRESSDAELGEARRATRLISERGHVRGRDLEADFESFIARFRKANP